MTLTEGAQSCILGQVTEADLERDANATGASDGRDLAFHIAAVGIKIFGECSGRESSYVDDTWRVGFHDACVAE